MAEERSLTGALSDTPIADEYRRLEAALYEKLPSDRGFDATAYPADVVARARRWWLGTMRTEYESASTFVDLAGQLREIDAPLDVQGLVLRMAQDELHHAAIAGQVVEAMGGEARIAPHRHRPSVHRDCAPEEAVLRSVIYGCCLSETVNAGRLAKFHGEAADPFVRSAFRLLLADERLHAQFGFYYLEERRAWLDAHPETKRSLSRYLRFAFAFLEQHMGSVPPDARPLSEMERAIGLVPLGEISATFQEIVLNACIPGLERFGLAAAEAWQRRTLGGGQASA